jgi:ParB family chromosome partitioning protein
VNVVTENLSEVGTRITGWPDEFVTLNLAALHESPMNPRKTFSEKAMADLERSIAEVGKVLVPLLVRPSGDNSYEILAGARRFRCAQKLGLVEVPCRILTGLSDRQALEIMVLENLQRSDVHPLEEAAGYRELLAMDESTKVEDIARKIGKSASYVYQRLKLDELIDSVKQAFFDKRITAGHAILIARLQPKQQKEILERMGGDAEAWPVRRLADWIQRDYQNDLASVPWSIDDGQLVKAAGSCNGCQKRIDAALSSDDGSELRCPDRTCFEKKMDAFIKRRFKEIQDETGKQPARVSTGYDGRDVKDALPNWEYHRIESKAERCDHAQTAIIVGGPWNECGQIIEVCIAGKCPKHGRFRDSSDRAEGSKQREQRKREEAKREAAANALRATMQDVLAKVAWPLPRAVLTMVLSELGHSTKAKLTDKEVATKIVESLAGDYKSKWFSYSAVGNKEIPELAKIYGVKLVEPEATAATALSTRQPAQHSKQKAGRSAEGRAEKKAGGRIKSSASRRS